MIFHYQYLKFVNRNEHSKVCIIYADNCFFNVIHLQQVESNHEVVCFCFDCVNSTYDEHIFVISSHPVQLMLEQPTNY